MAGAAVRTGRTRSATWATSPRTPARCAATHFSSRCLSAALLWLDLRAKSGAQRKRGAACAVPLRLPRVKRRAALQDPEDKPACGKMRGVHPHEPGKAHPFKNYRLPCARRTRYGEARPDGGWGRCARNAWRPMTEGAPTPGVLSYLAALAVTYRCSDAAGLIEPLLRPLRCLQERGAGPSEQPRERGEELRLQGLQRPGPAWRVQHDDCATLAQLARVPLSFWQNMTATAAGSLCEPQGMAANGGQRQCGVTASPMARHNHDYPIVYLASLKRENYSQVGSESGFGVLTNGPYTKVLVYCTKTEFSSGK